MNLKKARKQKRNLSYTKKSKFKVERNPQTINSMILMYKFFLQKIFNEIHTFCSFVIKNFESITSFYYGEEIQMFSDKSL